MITNVKDRIELHERRGLLPLRVTFLEVRSGLPAAVWKMLSVAERPGGDAFSETVSPVLINDKGTRAVVLTETDYNRMIGRVNDLETWLGECLSEEAS